MPARASGALRAMPWESCAVAASSSPAGTTWWTMPISCARRASIGWPVKSRCRVWAGPMISTSFWPSRKGTTRPMRASGMPKRATSAATRRSQWRASSQPPAMASPCTIAMVGWRERSTRPSTSMTPGSGSALCAPPRASISLRSIPEQKAGPAPRTTTTRTSRLASSVSKRSRSEARRAAFMALRCPGRLRVTVATPPSMAQRTSSDMRDLLGARGGREATDGLEHEGAPSHGIGIVALELEERGVDAVIEVALHVGADGGQGTAREERVDERGGNGRHRAAAVAGRPAVPHGLEYWSAPQPFLEGSIHRHVEVGGDVALDELLALRPRRVEVDEETRSDLDGLGIAADLASGRADDLHQARHVLGRVPVDDDAVADLACHAQHARAEGSDVDRYGHGGDAGEAEAVDGERLTLEDDALAREGRAEELRHLTYAGGGLVEHAAVPRLHDGLRARANAEDEAAGREVREACRHRGQSGGPAGEDVGDGDAEPHAGGGGGDGGQRREAVDAIDLVGPRVGVAQFLGLAREAAQLGEGEALQRHGQGPAFLHGASSRNRGDGASAV